jgi:copper resistance protein C
MRRVLTIAALAVTVLLGAGGTAFAHNVLITSDPQEGARLEAGPNEVRLTFDQPVRAGNDYNTVNIVGPGETYWTGGSARVEDTTVIAPVRALGPAGTYTIGYRVLSNDGHPVSGKITFTLTRPGTGTPAPPPKAQEPGQAQVDADAGMPIWPWITGAVVLVALGLVLALRLGKPARKQ